MPTAARTRRRAVLLALAALCFAVPAFAQSIIYVGMPAAVGSGLQTTTIRARLSTGAHGGVTVHIASADTNLALVSDGQQTPGGEFVDIFVPNGSVDAIFYIQALEDTTGSATITSSVSGFTDAVDSLNVVVPGVEIIGLGPTQNVLNPDDPFQVRVGISAGTYLSAILRVRAGGPGLTATLTNSASGVGELVTQSVTSQVVTVAIADGQSTSPASVAAGGVAFNGIGAGSTVVTASIPGFDQVNNGTRNVDVTAPALSFLALPADVGIGLQKGTLRARISGTEHGGTTVHLESGDSSRVLLSLDRFTEGVGMMDVFVADGALDVIFYAQVLDTSGTGPVSINATAAGLTSASSAVTAVTPAFRLNSLQPSIDVLDPIDEFQLLIGRPDGGLTYIAENQQARGGGPGITFTVTSSDSSVGVLETLTQRNDSVQVYIGPGQNTSPLTIALGGVGFDGVGIGLSQVTAQAPGFIPVASGVVDVTVTQPTMQFIVDSYGVPSGLQSQISRSRLGATQHGGVVVHIESSDSNLVLLSTSDATVGSGALDVFVPNGSIDATFFMQGVEDTTGTVELYTSAPGFVPDTTTVNLTTPYIRITPGSLPPSIDTLDPPDDFYVQLGIVVGPNFLTREVRPGSPGVPVTVQLDTTLAELQTLGGNGDSVVVVVPALASSTPTSYGAGGYRFDPIAEGVVNLTATAPGFLPDINAIDQVTITAPTMSFSGLAGAVVGAGLETTLKRVILSTGTHGGTTVHIVSQDSSLALVTAVPGAPGAGDIFVDVPNGSIYANFYIQGLDDTTGTVWFDATASAFISTSDSARVVQPGVEILSLQTSIDVSDGQDPFSVRVGVPDGAQTYIQYIQARRGGAPPLVVSVETSNAPASQLLTDSLTSDSVTVYIDPGENISPSTVVNGGVAHVPVAAGQTLITASIPGFIQTGGAQKTVDITNQNVFIAGVSGYLGAGLQTPVLTAELGESNHGGVTVHIEVDDTTKALVSLNALVVGSTALDVPLLNGQTDVAFYVQSRDSSLGTVNVSASAPNFATAMEAIEIVPAGTEIIVLADSIDVADEDDEFIVRVGPITNDSTGIVEPQGVWAGSDTARVTVSSSDGGVGEIVTSSEGGAAVVADIPPGQVQTAGSVVTGGVAFHPVNAGATVVKAEVPDFVVTDAGSTTVYVTGTLSGIEPPPSRAAFALEQNVPNPFNPTTSIRFSLPERSYVRLDVFDVSGRRIATLVNGEMPAGLSTVDWDGRDHRGGQVSSGVYFYRIAAGAHVKTRKMLLLK